MLKVSTSWSPLSTNVLFHTVTAVSSQHNDAMHTSATKGPFKNIFKYFFPKSTLNIGEHVTGFIYIYIYIHNVLFSKNALN